jgi:hypothetical protein
MPDEYEKPNRISALEEKLYSPHANLQAKDRKPLREKEYGVAGNWGEEPPRDLSVSSLSVDESKKNWFMRFFVAALMFFLAAAGYVGWRFFIDDGIDAKNVDIVVNAPLTIGAGEEFAFDVLMQNKNAMAMQTVDVEIELPDGTRSVKDVGEKYEYVRENIEDIAVGQIGKKSYAALLFGEEGDKKEIIVRLNYRVEGSNALFEKEKRFDVVLKSTPVRLTVTNVKELTSGQALSFNIELVSNSTQVLENVMVQATYPFGFRMLKSSIPSRDDKKTWIIPKLSPKEVVSFTVDGTLEGQNNEERYFSFVVGLEDEVTGQPEVVFTTSGTTVGLARAFLELDLAINKVGSDIIAIDPDAIQDTQISFRNNSNFPLRNVSLDLKIEGNALSKTSVQVPEGFYQSTTNTIRWDNTTKDTFASIPTGSSGSVSFSFAGAGVRSSYLAINPELKLTATVEGNRNPENDVPEQIENSIVKTVRLNTQPTVETSSEYYTSTFANSGPVPPKAEQSTSYAAVVEVSNTSNKLAGSIVTMRIPNYVTYTGKFSPSNEKFSYDPKTRIAAWDLGTVSEKTGYEGNPKRKISFQVSVLPSVSQAGTAPNLVYDIQLSGSDMFTGKQIVEVGQPISTDTVDSKGFYDSQVSR